MLILLHVLSLAVIFKFALGQCVGDVWNLAKGIRVLVDDDARGARRPDEDDVFLAV
jgi:hypothetical protein